MADSIATRVMAAVARTPGVEPTEVKPESTFEELGMTSLDAIALVNDLEEEFAIAMPNEEAMGLSTVGEAIECVRRLAVPT